MGNEVIPECLGCGACCFGKGERYIPVTGEDHARLSEAAETLTQFVGNRCYMRMEQGHCAALDVRADGQFFCTVYEQRPNVCRELARGSVSCEAELWQKRGRTRKALLPLLDARR